jgi:hypothetical protein
MFGQLIFFERFVVFLQPATVDFLPHLSLRLTSHCSNSRSMSASVKSLMSFFAQSGFSSPLNFFGVDALSKLNNTTKITNLLIFGKMAASG